MNIQEELKILKGDLSHVHIMVIGDVMLDRYIIGTVSRISPEAPVPVILWNRTEDKLGGATNVAANLKAMGCKVSIMGLCGEDSDSVILEKLLLDIGCDHVYLVHDPERPTTVKTRIVAELHQIARVDHESDDEISADLQNEGLRLLHKIFSEEKIDVVILQDYNKGFLHDSWISKIIKLAKENQIKIAVDPKKNHFFEYRGVDLFKPNLKEALQVMDSSYKTLADLPPLAKLLKNKLLCNKLMITLASDGLWLEGDVIQKQYKTTPRKVADVSGAGDTVISLAAICMACALSDLFMASCCNVGGGQVCEKFGVVPINKIELIRELSD